jgi:hypothetical protein
VADLRPEHVQVWLTKLQRDGYALDRFEDYVEARGKPMAPIAADPGQATTAELRWRRTAAP